MCFNKIIYIFLVGLFFSQAGYSQLNRNKVFAGTQFPLQITAGYQYSLHPKVSVRLQGGVLTHPLDKVFLYSMEQSGLNKGLSNIIKESFDVGYLAMPGVNYHINKYYVGIYGQYGHLKGQGQLTEALYTYYKKDLPPIPDEFQPLLNGLLIRWRSNIINAGILAGRQFLLPNPRFSINAEVGFTKTFTSSSKFSSNNSALDETPLADQIYARLDKEFRNAFVKYGYYPSINLYLVYNFQ